MELALEEEEGAMRQRMQAASGSLEGKERNSPLECLERNVPC